MPVETRRRFLQSVASGSVVSVAGCVGPLNRNSIPGGSTSISCSILKNSGNSEPYVFSDDLEIAIYYQQHSRIEFRNREYDPQDYVGTHEQAERYDEHYLILSNQEIADDLVTRSREKEQNELDDLLDETDFSESFVLIVANHMQANNELRLDSIGKADGQYQVAVEVTKSDSTDASTGHALFIRVAPATMTTRYDWSKSVSWINCAISSSSLIRSWAVDRFVIIV